MSEQQSRGRSQQRNRRQAETVADLLRAIDRTLAAASEVKRHRDRLMRLAGSSREGGR